MWSALNVNVNVFKTFARSAESYNVKHPMYKLLFYELGVHGIPVLPVPVTQHRLCNGRLVTLLVRVNEDGRVRQTVLESARRESFEAI
uniref:Uncharacterized protein n=1 Tax=Timema bartmani TaxID=61472 RepID=A0A7R9FED1_9NEOP|nr:unnamed protein product [Timema bartmani]